MRGRDFEDEHMNSLDRFKRHFENFANVKPKKAIAAVVGIWLLGASLFLGFWGTVSAASAAEPLNEYGETQEQADRLQELADHQRLDYLPVILICPANMPFWQCSPVKGFSRAKANGQKASNPMGCTQNGYEQAAKASIFQTLAPGEYIKVMCVHEKGTVDETGEGKL